MKSGPPDPLASRSLARAVPASPGLGGRFTLLLHVLGEAIPSLRRETKRLIPMALGIVWGMASVMVLLAVANGFELSQKHALAAYGDRFIMLRLNRAELDRAAGSEERRLQMDAHDLERLRVGAPAIRRFSPMNMAYRGRITGQTGAASSTYIAGVLPEIAQIRNLPLAEGRFFNALDEAERRRVIVLGPMVRQQLFGHGPALGKSVRIGGFSFSSIASRDPRRSASQASFRGASAQPQVASGSGSSASSSSSSQRPISSSSSPAASPAASTSRSQSSRPRSSFTPPPAWTRTDRTGGMQGEFFEVVGVLKDAETQRETYVSVSRLALVPFSTSTVVFDRDFGTMLLEPRTTEDRDLALYQFRQVMGARYGFEPDDRNAVVIYFDAIERARAIAAIFGGVRLFLAAVGSLILAIGAIGVMNVVLVSVASRTFEIGLRKALGATPAAIYAQFLLETIILCFGSGLLGFLLGAAAIALLSGLPLPDGFSTPVVDMRTALVSFGILTALSVLVGLYPARRASQLVPVQALRARG